jgi:hypothetical protein
MSERTPGIVKNQLSWLVSGLLLSFIFLALILAEGRPANALPIPAAKVGPLQKVRQHGCTDDGVQVLPYISSRAGFAFHKGYAIEWQRRTAPISRLDQTTSSSLVGFDCAI